jgi:hypothetical protein
MIFTTLDELNGVLMRHPMYKYARLQLDNYLVIVAENEDTDDFLASLEEKGVLPLTAAWFSQEACKVRLYQRAEDISTGYVQLTELIMSIKTGADARCLVASPSNRLRDYDDLEDESLVENTPAALNEQALKILTNLIFLTKCLWAENRQAI